MRIDENEESTTAWTQDVGATVYGMSVTKDGSVLTADADGRIIKWNISAETGASEAWTYQHSDGELAHQVTVSPDGVADGIWSAAYDNTIHKICENEDGEPERMYIDDSYSDSVREVRLPYEHIGTWPEQWH